MAEQLKTSIVLDLTGNLEARAKQYGADLQKLGNVGNRAFGAMSRSAHMLGQGLDKLGNRWTGLITGAGAALTVRSIALLDAQMTRIGTNANVSAEQVAKLKDRIFEVASRPDVNVKIGDLANGVQSLIEATGNADFANQNLENLAHIMQATGETGDDIGNLIGQIRTFGATTPQEIYGVVNAWAEMGKKSGVTMREMITGGQQLMATYEELGFTGPKALMEIGAMMSMATKALGNPRRAASALQTALTSLQQIEANPQERMALTMMGIKFADKNGKPRDPAEVIEDIIRTLHGNVPALQKVFSTTGPQAFAPLIEQYKSGKPMDALQQFMAMSDDNNALLRDSARNADTAAQSVNRLTNAWTQFTDTVLSKPLKKVGAEINQLSPTTLQTGLKVGAMVGGGLLAAYGLRNVGRLGKGVFNAGRYILGGKTGKAIDSIMGEGGALGGLGLPVRVMNWPGSLGGAGGSGTNLPGAIEKEAGKVLRPGLLRSGLALARSPVTGIGAAMGLEGAGSAAATVGVAAAGVAAAGAVGYGIGTVINKELLEKTTWGQKLGDSIGSGIAHALALFGDKTAQQAIADSKAGNGAPEQPESRVHLKVTFDRFGNPLVTQVTSNDAKVRLDAALANRFGSIGAPS